MLDAAVHFFFPDAYWNKVWPETKPQETEWRHLAKNSEYDVADGKVTITTTDKKQMWGLLEVAGLQQLRTESMGKMRATALGPVRERLKTMPKQDVFDGCLHHGVPCGIFKTLDEALADEQIKHNGTVEDHEDQKGHRYRAARPPARFGKTASGIQRPPPSIGADTDAILSVELGLSASDINALRSEGVV